MCRCLPPFVFSSIHHTCYINFIIFSWDFPPSLTSTSSLSFSLSFPPVLHLSLCSLSNSTAAASWSLLFTRWVDGHNFQRTSHLIFLAFKRALQWFFFFTQSLSFKGIPTAISPIGLQTFLNAQVWSLKSFEASLTNGQPSWQHPGQLFQGNTTRPLRADSGCLRCRAGKYEKGTSCRWSGTSTKKGYWNSTLDTKVASKRAL